MINRTKEGVYTATGDIVVARREDIETLKEEASKAKLKRARLCWHQSQEDRIQEMTIAFTKESYIRPHKHIGKTESAYIIEGIADLVFLNKSGEVEEVREIGDSSSARSFYYRINQEIYHTLLIKSPYFVMHEVTNGPFVRGDVVFLPNSPDDKDEVVTGDYIKDLEKRAEMCLRSQR